MLHKKQRRKKGTLLPPHANGRSVIISFSWTLSFSQELSSLQLFWLELFSLQLFWLELSSSQELSFLRPSWPAPSSLSATVSPPFRSLPTSCGQRAHSSIYECVPQKLCVSYSFKKIFSIFFSSPPKILGVSIEVRTAFIQNLSDTLHERYEEKLCRTKRDHNGRTSNT